MKILSLGLDIQALDPTSQVASRIRLIGQLVDFYTVIIPAHGDTYVKLNNQAEVYAIGGSNKIVQLFKTGFFTYQILKARHYDLITVQDIYFLALIGFFLSWFFDKPLEVQVHGFEKKTLIRLLISRFIFKKATGIRVVSHRLKKLLVGKYNIDDKKIYVIPIGIKDEGQVVTRRNYKTSTPFNFLTVGRLVSVKRIDFLIKALTETFSETDNIIFNIAGEGPDRSKLELLVDKLNPNFRVNFLGYQKNLNDEYQNADAFVFASKEEGWGLVLVEAALHGLPILTSDVGLVGEVLKPDEDVLVVSSKNIKDFGLGLRNLYEDPALREYLGQNARKKVLNMPKAGDIVKSYVIAWQNLLG